MTEIFNKIIRLGVLDSDYTGLFMSLPIQLLNGFTDNNGICEFNIEGVCGTNMYNSINLSPIPTVNFKTLYDFRNRKFIHSENGKNVANKILLWNEVKYGDKLCICGLVMEILLGYSMINLYDAFFYKDIEQFDTYNYINRMDRLFMPFLLSRIKGNVDLSISEQNSHADRISIVVDDYTHVIRGITNPNDILYSEYNQIIVPMEEILKLNLPMTECLINNYKIDNGIIEPIKTITPEMQDYIDIKNMYFKLHELDLNVNKRFIDNLLFKQYKSLEEVQTFLKSNNENIENIKHNIDLKEKELEQKYRKTHDNIISKILSENKFKYNASVCLLIKDENKYLEEWLDWYYDLGIDHFYIYDNGSTIPISQTVAEIKNGKYTALCDIIDWSTGYKHMQYDCYENCMLRFGSESRWIGFFDTDEFLEFPEDNVSKFLKKYESYMAVWIPWEVYNANNMIQKGTGKMMIDFTNKIIDPISLWGKVFVQPFRVKKMFVHDAIGVNPDIDYMIMSNGKPHVTHYFEELKGMYLGKDIWKDGKIKHYITRSYEEWCEKMERGTCDPNFERKFKVFFTYNPEMSYLKEKNDINKILETKQKYS